MKTGTMVDYAKKRTIEHLTRFNQLYEEITHEIINEPWLNHLEKIDNIFPNIDYLVYSEKEKPQ